MLALLPRVNWDTVPLFFNACNFSGPLNEAAVTYLTKPNRFACVTIDKGQGIYSTDNVTTTAEERILRNAKILKVI